MGQEILITIIIIIIIVCGTVIAIPVVVIGLRAVVYRMHNRWILKKIDENPQFADTAGKMRACGEDDALQTDEIGE